MHEGYNTQRPHFSGKERFDSEETEEIAEATLWRVVADKWGGDWVDESIPGQVFIYPKAGVWRDRMIEAEVEATCDRDEVLVVKPLKPEDSYLAPLGQVSHSVTISLKEPIPEVFSSVIEHIKETDPDGFEEWLEYEGLREDQIFEPGQFATKRCAEFQFFAGGGYRVRRYSAIFHKSGDMVWDSLEGFNIDEDESEEEPNEESAAGFVSPRFADDLTVDDLKDIRVGVEVLGVSDQVRSYLAGLCEQ